MNLTKISRKMSYLLRHSTDPLYIDLNGGWADVDLIVQTLRKKYPEVTVKEIEQIAESDEKGRYSFDRDRKKIRANQGHSIPEVVIEMKQPKPPELLYHGTAERFLDPIMKEGLKPMGRQFVHISSDYETALKVGKRHGRPAVLIIDAKQFVKDGNKLYLSENGIWQAKTVPAKYLKIYR